MTDVERKLAAILSADVVGYSRLMERDEAGTLARLQALRRVFETDQYGVEQLSDSLVRRFWLPIEI